MDSTGLRKIMRHITNSYRGTAGVTLVEILVVVVVIAILAGMVIGLARRIDNQGKEQLVKNTFEILNCALEQFADYGYRYKDLNYADFDFPLDCNDYLFSNPPNFDLRTTLMSALGAMDVSIISGTNDPNYSGSEAMYFFLSRVPDCRVTLDKVDKSFITNLDNNRTPITINVAGSIVPLMRVIDCWGTTLRYDYYDERAPTFDDMRDSKKTFPVITSAGPDRVFDTVDDITSR